jgi:hypothetical protein
VCPGILQRCNWKNAGLMSALCTREKTNAREPAQKVLLPSIDEERGMEGTMTVSCKWIAVPPGLAGATQERFIKYELLLP